MASKGGKDNKKKKKEKKIVGPPTPDPVDEESKEFYVNQIREHVAKIEKYQALSEELEAKNKELRSQFEQLNQDKRDIVDFIKKKMEEKADEIKDLQEQLSGLQQTKDAEKEAFEQQLQQLRAEYHETRDQLTTENMALSAKLASLEDFKVHREELVAKLVALEEALLVQDREHKQEVYGMERKQVMDRDRLKKEMVTRVNQVAAEFRKASNRQMAETTKRTIRENISINSQMTKMSDATEELIKENRELRKKELEQRREIENLEEMEKQLACKNVNNEKIIRALTLKCQEQNDLLEEANVKDQELTDLENQFSELQNELAEAQPDLAAIAIANEKLEGQLTRVKAEYERRQALRRRLEQTVMNCADVVKAVITSVPGEYCKDRESESGPTREGLLESLLLVLNNARECENIDEITEEQNARKSSKGLERHYKLGDAGLIPRPDLHISTNYEKIKLEEARIKAFRKQPSSSQTPSSHQAMYFADELVCKYGPSTLERESLPPLVPPQNNFKGVVK